MNVRNRDDLTAAEVRTLFQGSLETELARAVEGSDSALALITKKQLPIAGNQLRAVENAEYGARHGHLNTRIKMGRIGAR